MERDRMDLDFASRGTRLAGWLFRPKGVVRPPVVVMAHGLGATRDLGLDVFARRFVSAGLAAFVFDYRGFGDSDGLPRHWVSPRRHGQDWDAALAFIRTRAEVDDRRVGLWGTSFSGGHVIAAAARNGRVKAVVAQVPFVDGRASLKGQNLPYMLQAVGHGLRDLVRQILDRTPHYVPVVAKPGQFALLNKEDALDGYLALVPQGSRWRNECAARVLLEIPRFRPILSAPMVAAPVLLVAAEQDAYIPIAHVVRLADQLPQAELVRLPVGHFDVYTGEWLEQTLALETDFFVKWLRG